MKIFTLIFLLNIIVHSQISAAYCPAPSTSTAAFGIVSVKLEEINRTTVVNDGYVDFAATDTATFGLCGTHDLILITDGFFPFSPVSVFIDWNQDQDFDDLDEVVLLDTFSFNGDTTLFKISVPNHASLGCTRMRIRAYNGTDGTDPCATILGNTEDYTICVGDFSTTYKQTYLTQRWCAMHSPGDKEILAGKVNVETRYCQPQLNTLNTIYFSTKGTTLDADITDAYLFYTSNVDSFNKSNPLGSISNPAGGFSFVVNQSLSLGDNYFWLMYDISSNATNGHYLDVEIDSIEVNGNRSLPYLSNHKGTIKLLKDTLLNDCDMNLVYNPSFELVGCCGDINDAKLLPKDKEGWEILYEAGNPTSATSDYLAGCKGNTPGGGPFGFGFQAPRTGDSYGGHYNYLKGYKDSSDWIEYITLKLKESLSMGQEYCVEFYYSLAENHALPTDAQQAYFSESVPTNALDAETDGGTIYPNSGRLPVTPQIKNTDGNVLSDTLGWQKVWGSFTPVDTGLKYMTLGNFEIQSNTATDTFFSSSASSYYFVEDVLVVPVPKFSYVSYDTTVCAGDSVELVALGTCTTWWVDGTDTFYTNTIKVASNTTKEYIAIGNNGGTSCYSFDTVIIMIVDTVILNTWNDTAICQTSTPMQLQLSVSGANDYEWTPGNLLDDSLSSSPIAQITDSIRFKVSGRIGSCPPSTDSFDIALLPLPLFTLMADTFCGIDEFMQDAGTGWESYLWSDSKITQTNTINTNGFYWVTVSDSNNCPATDTFEVFIYDKIRILGDSIICKDDELFLQATGGGINYTWYSSGIYQGSGSTFIASPSRNEVYLVIARNICNESDSIDFGITVQNCEIFIPNVFSPNGDGENDVFKIRGDGINDIYTKIYDRWGNKVFETTDMNQIWDGNTIDGKENNAGVYVYSIVGRFINGSDIKLKGNITLIK